ncbi:type II secretion system F family protein [Escherichia coli]|uniref:type II secretion system F family protein n=1 Tax=Escherichia coli TaxID=562 RepID=UPI00259D1B09|nr:type II secretion system F family protein [Escherichia coli]MDM4887228.1 type II secretion system F family protein [Escherichia coli]
MGQQSSNKRLGDVLNQVAAPSLKGSPFRCITAFSHAFRFALSSLVKAGEKSGLLAPVLEKLADYNENRQKIPASSFSH